MIDEIHAENVALIASATIRPADGLTVLTGETGAGKTALLGALKLLVGERADASSVREGTDALLVEGRFFSKDDPDGTVVRRRVSTDGRGRVEVDGRMASVRELSSGVGSTVDLCGQHEHQRLLSVSNHVDLLDAWAGPQAQEAKAAYREALTKAEDAGRELRRVQELASSVGERLDEARFVLSRIDEVDPKEGELDELERDLPRAEHAEALMRAASVAHEAVAGEGGATDCMATAVSSLKAVSTFDTELGAKAQALESALIDVEDVAEDLRRYSESVDFDPSSLEQMQERMARLQGLMRTYGPRMVDVLSRRAEAAEVLDAAGDSGEREREARRVLDEAEADLAAKADALDEVRATAAPRLCSAASAQMERLQMGSAELDFSLERLDRDKWSSSGPSRVELLYRPAAGLTARPLRRIASGGEVSRVMLACKVVLGEADGVDTLVFDEVDAGVGGATANALAAVLVDLAKTHQVIVVTHLAQVAVAAERQYLVSKTDADVPETSIVEVTGDDRVREVARMLSGDATAASLAHAAEMLSKR